MLSPAMRSHFHVWIDQVFLAGSTFGIGGYHIRMQCCAALAGLQREVFPEQGQGSGGTGRQSTMGCLNLRTFPSRLLHGALLDIDRGIHDLPTFIAQLQCSSWDPRGVNLY
jgi:hypothetical protein